MRGPTHILVGAASASIFYYFDIHHDYPLIALSATAGIAALLPDLDGSESTLENVRILGVKPLKIPAKIIDMTFSHRGFLHSLLGLLLVAFLLLGFLPTLPDEIVYSILIGYGSHLVADALTPMGIPWLYPLIWRPTLLTKYFAIRTGSVAEIIFFIGILLFFLIYLSKIGYIHLPSS